MPITSKVCLFEGWNEGWESWGGMQSFDFTKPYADFDMDEITRYAREKNVQIIGHHETGGNIPNYERQMEKAIKWYTDKGIHILKTGYAGAFPDGHSHHGQYGVNHYQKVVETAARYRMTLDAHEPIKDTGIRRTWPNMMTREGARGMEWNAWSEGNPPSHHEMLPFTAYGMVRWSILRVLLIFCLHRRKILLNVRSGMIRIRAIVASIQHWPSSWLIG